MRYLTTVAATAALLALAAQSALAVTCSVLGVNYTCDLNCTSSSCNYSGFNPTTCDQAGGNTDGRCVFCGDGGANLITGTAGDDIICGKGGADTLIGDPTLTDPGNDILSGETGDDILRGRSGNDVLLGGNNNDLLDGMDGDDELDGGTGNDTLYGGKGDNVLRGGDGDDWLETGVSPMPSNLLGSILCGGKGTDSLTAVGYGQYCMDCGPDSASEEARYVGPQFVGPRDGAFIRNCGSVIADPLPYSSGRSCNCQDE